MLASDVKKSAQVMVFCNTLSSCRCIELALQEHGIATICYHGEVPKNERKEIIDQFSGLPSLACAQTDKLPFQDTRARDMCWSARTWLQED